MNQELEFGIQSEYVKLLNEIGYVAIGKGMKKEAESIFDALIKIRPNSELPLIGLAVCKINFGNFKEALDLLAIKANKINPDSDLVKAFTALVLMFTKQKKECKNILENILDNNKDATAVALAKSIKEEL